MPQNACPVFFVLKKIKKIEKNIVSWVRQAYYGSNTLFIISKIREVSIMSGKAQKTGGWRSNKWMRAAIPALLLHCSIGTVYC